MNWMVRYWLTGSPFGRVSSLRFSDANAAALHAEQIRSDARVSFTSVVRTSEVPS